MSVLSAVVAVSALAGCDSDRAGAPGSGVVIAANAPDQESWNTTLTYTENGRLKVRLVTAHARRYLDRMETLLDSGVYVEFYDVDGTVNATLLADSARIDDRTQDMAAFGSVHVDSRRNRTTVDTETIFYDRDADSLRSDSRVYLDDEARGRTLQGVGFRSDAALHGYTIYSASGTARGSGR